MKREACSQILYFLFSDLERAYESKNRGGFMNYKREEGGSGEGENIRSMDIIGPT